MLKIIKTTLLIIVLLSFDSKLNAQFCFNPITVTTEFSKQDSTLTVSYFNNNETDVLLWVGSYVIDYLWTSNQYSYYPNPIKNEIYLFEKGSFNFMNVINSNDSVNILNKKNYKLVSPKERFSIVLSIKDKEILRKICKSKVYVRYCVLDIINLCLSQKKSNNTPCIVNNNNTFFSDNVLHFSNVQWSNEDSLPNEKKFDLPISVKKTVNSSVLSIPVMQVIDLAPNKLDLLNFQKSYQSIIEIKTK